MMKYITCKELSFFIGMLVSIFSHAQQVKGLITDADGQVLPGVSVVEKGTANGVQTDFDGNYTITLRSENATLIFSSIGFKTQEILIDGKDKIDIQLEEDVQSLDEVVVVGYGTQRKGNLTGAVSTVSSKAIEGRPVADFQSALQGQIAGLQITSNSGTPGGATNVTIRGTGSITGGSRPLYVIDGNIISTSIGGGGDPFATINASDIESVNVLKDASAAAIYGARAANGVIIITTKRGKSGRPQINFNTFAGFQHTTNTLDLLNAQQYQQVQNTVRDNSEITRIPNLDGTTLTTNTDWQDQVFRSGILRNYELNASGGGETTRYYASLSHYDEEGIIIGTGFRRTSLRLNTDTALGRFKFGNSLTVSRSKYDREFRPFGRSILYWALANSPAIEVRNPDNIGGFNGPTNNDGDVGVLNPVAAQSLIDNESFVNRILGNVFAEYEFLDGLKYRVNFAADITNFTNNLFAPFFQLTPDEAVVGLPNGAQVNDSRGESISLLLENTLNYKKSFGGHNLDILLGYTVQDDETSRLGVSTAGQSIGEGFPVVGASNDLISPPTGFRVEERTISYIGRAMYNYDNTYLTTFNFRRDGSSIFSSDNFFDNFFSGSIGWVISNETFMENSFFSNLKMRASYGFLGNDQINPNATISVLNNDVRYVFGEQSTVFNGIAPGGRIANPGLVWEKQEQLNIGLDFGLLGGKLNFNIDYFKKNSSDLLLNFQLPSATGFDNLFLNAAEVENSGLEIVGNYNEKFGDFEFGFGVNISFLNNEVISLLEGLDAIERNSSNEFTFRNRIAPGNSLFTFYGFQVDGIYQSQSEVDNAAVTPLSGTQAGDFIFRDVNGDGIINEGDRTFIGDANQDIQYGFTFNLRYKNFDLVAQFQGVAGNDIWSDTKFYTQSYFRTSNLSTAVLDAWTPDNTNTSQPRAVANTVSNNDLASSYFVEDGSYLRLKNLQLGYNISKNTLDYLGLYKARIYVAGQNVFTITDYAGFDPEIGTNLGNNALGFDNVVYPQARRFTIGLQLGF